MMFSFRETQPRQHLYYFVFYDRSGEIYEAMYDEKNHDWEIYSMMRNGFFAVNLSEL